MTSEQAEIRKIDRVRPEGMYVRQVRLYPMVLLIERVKGDCTVDTITISKTEEALDMIRQLNGLLSCPDLDNEGASQGRAITAAHFSEYEGVKYTIGVDMAEETKVVPCRVCGSPNCIRETHWELSKRMRS